MSAIERFDRVNVRINIRPEYQGLKAKPGVFALNGREMLLEAMWLCEADERYPGEWAMGAVSLEDKRALLDAGTVWIASGDVEVLP